MGLFPLYGDEQLLWKIKIHPSSNKFPYYGFSLFFPVKRNLLMHFLLSEWFLLVLKLCLPNILRLLPYKWCNEGLGRVNENNNTQRRK